LVIGQVAAKDETAERAGHFAVDEVGGREFLVAETIRIEIARKEHDDEAGIDNPHSPRPSCTAERIAFRSTPPRTLDRVSRTTSALSRTT
jgi:hypothetical protein